MENKIGETPSATSSTEVASTSQSCSSTMNVQICPTTGGQFDVVVPTSETVDGLKRTVGKKLKVPKDRITLLFKDKLLKEGVLSDHQVSDWSKITLLPNVESGLMTNKGENSVMQALENLTEPQVNEFLTGKAPLTLAMRLGDHMMFVQLQLSTTQMHSKKGHKSSKYNKNTGARLERQANVSSNSKLSSTTNSQTIISDNTTNNRVTSPELLASQSTPSLLDCDNEPLTTLDTEALAQASRNLSKRLKELSIVTAKPTDSFSSSSSNTKVPSGAISPSSSSARATQKGPGAIIESMQHHGQGVYSGTFSGSLNPALQDKQGNPKKSVNTIIHILNDLLGATPQYKTGHASKHRERRERPSSSSHTSKSKQLNSVGERKEMTSENRALRGKMEHLQMMMEQRRQKRKARREARSAPYNWSSDKQSSTESKDGDPNAMAVDANVLTDNMTDNALSQIKQETVMV